MNVHTTLEQSVPQRLARVRQAMAAAGIDALLVPSADPTFPSTCRVTGRGASGCRVSTARSARWWSRLGLPGCGSIAAIGNKQSTSWQAVVSS